MKEWIDLRVIDNRLLRQLPSGLGKDLDSPEEIAFHKKYDPDYLSARRIILPRNDPRWQEFMRIVNTLPQEIREGSFIGEFERRYNKKELENAEILHLGITKVFEPEGERCGTVHDDSAACRFCGAGRRQVSDLHLQLRRVHQGWPSIPQAKHTGIAQTIADEVIVSQQLVELIKKHKITGADFGLVRSCGAKGKVTPLWQQLRVTGKAGRTTSPTEFGIGPFEPDEKGEHRCPLGHTSGLNLLSEIYIERKNWDGSDICATEDLVGVRRGVLVPAPMILISPKFYRLLQENNIRGFKVEVAHLK